MRLRKRSELAVWILSLLLGFAGTCLYAGHAGIGTGTDTDTDTGTENDTGTDTDTDIMNSGKGSRCAENITQRLPFCCLSPTFLPAFFYPTFDTQI